MEGGGGMWVEKGGGGLRQTEGGMWVESEGEGERREKLKGGGEYRG